MKISHIIQIIRENGDCSNFRAECSQELTEYKRGLFEKGRSAPIYLEGEEILKLTSKDFNLLCESLLKEKGLCLFELNYICEACLISDKITIYGDELRDQIEYLTEIEINSVIIPELINKLKFG